MAHVIAAWLGVALVVAGVFMAGTDTGVDLLSFGGLLFVGAVVVEAIQETRD